LLPASIQALGGGFGALLDAAQILSLQRTAGNQAVSRAIADGRLARAPSAPTARAELSPQVVESMRRDIDVIVELLSEQILTSSEEARIVATAKRYADLDAGAQPSGTPHLDKFLLMLKTRTFPRSTARSGWVEQWVNAFDTCWHELEGKNLTDFAAIVGGSAKQGASGPESVPSENLWSTLGKHEAMGVWGILKGLGLTISGVADVAIWAAWKQTGAPLGAILEHYGVKDAAKTPAISGYLSKSYDDVAKLLGDTMGVDPAKDATLFGQSSYEIGEFGGKVVGALTMAGASGGGAGNAIAGGTKALGVVGALKGVEDAGTEMRKRIAELQKRTPPPTLTEIFSDETVLLEAASVLGNILGAASGPGDAAPTFAKALAKFGWVVDAAQLAPTIGKAFRDYNDPVLAQDPEKRDAALRDHIASIVGTILSTAGSKHDEAAAERAERGKQEFDAEFQERYNAPREPGAEAASTAPPETTLVPGAEGMSEFTPEHFENPPDVGSAQSGESGTREYSPDQLETVPAVGGAESGESGTREYSAEHFDQPVDVGPRGSGSPGTGPTGTSEVRTGMNYNVYNAAEVALGGRWDYDPELNALRSVEFDVPATVGNEGTRGDRFGQEETMLDIDVRQPSHESHTASGHERGHAAAQQLSGGDPDVAETLMIMSNVWAMEGLGATGVNQGAYKAVEDHYIAVKAQNPEADIRVRVVAEFGSPPRTFTPTRGAPRPVAIPDAFVITILVTPLGGQPEPVQTVRVPNQAGTPRPQLAMPNIPR